MKVGFRTQLFFSLLFLLCLGGVSQKCFAQTKLSEEAMAQDFIRFLAAVDKKEIRVDKEMLPWKLAEVYANDSLWAKVNLTDETRVLARTGWFGAGPLLRYDHQFTSRDFQNLKRKIAAIDRQEWAPADFSDSVMVLPDKVISSSAYYAFSWPLAFPDKKLVLVKRRFRGERRMSRWSQLEVYQMVKPGQYKLLNTYLRKDL